MRRGEEGRGERERRKEERGKRGREEGREGEKGRKREGEEEKGEGGEEEGGGVGGGRVLGLKPHKGLTEVPVQHIKRNCQDPSSVPACHRVNLADTLPPTLNSPAQGLGCVFLPSASLILI